MTNRILPQLEADRTLIERELAKYLDRHDPDFEVLYDAMRYSALGPGKRIRPFLVLAFCRLYGGQDEAALPFACALEMIQAYSLIHDDLPCMDDDDFRRGRPSCHRRFKEATALLAGDALLTAAFETVSANTAVPPSVALEAVRLLSQYAGAAGMIGGQQIDLDAETHEISYETLLHMNRLKTGQLIEVACRLGCLAAGMNDHTAAIRYAQNVGLAFQIEDDLLDDGEEDEKTTFLRFMTHEQAKDMIRSLTRDAQEAITTIEGHEILCELADYLCTRKI